MENYSKLCKAAKKQEDSSSEVWNAVTVLIFLDRHFESLLASSPSLNVTTQPNNVITTLLFPSLAWDSFGKDQTQYLQYFNTVSTVSFKLIDLCLWHFVGGTLDSETLWKVIQKPFSKRLDLIFPATEQKVNRLPELSQLRLEHKCQQQDQQTIITCPQNIVLWRLQTAFMRDCRNKHLEHKVEREKVESNFRKTTHFLLIFSQLCYLHVVYHF